MERELIQIAPIELIWSDWFKWHDIEVDVRKGGIRLPNGEPGVYEAKYVDQEERLTIGKASDLRMRVKQGLVKGKTRHSAGQSIRENENAIDVVVRWAVTDRPSAVEEELHRRYLAKFGKLPKYVKHT